MGALAVSFGKKVFLTSLAYTPLSLVQTRLYSSPITETEQTTDFTRGQSEVIFFVKRIYLANRGRGKAPCLNQAKGGICLRVTLYFRMLLAGRRPVMLLLAVSEWQYARYILSIRMLDGS